jgi:hypothetical protein
MADEADNTNTKVAINWTAAIFFFLLVIALILAGGRLYFGHWGWIEDILYKIAPQFLGTAVLSIVLWLVGMAIFGLPPPKAGQSCWGYTRGFLLTLAGIIFCSLISTCVSLM